MSPRLGLATQNTACQQHGFWGLLTQTVHSITCAVGVPLVALACLAIRFLHFIQMFVLNNQMHMICGRLLRAHVLLELYSNAREDSVY